MKNKIRHWSHISVRHVKQNPWQFAALREYGMCVKKPRGLWKFEFSQLIKNKNENDNVAVSVDQALDYFIIMML